MTPFLSGQAAARAGEPMDANPHERRMGLGDDYPGDWANWKAGWINETAMMKHDGRNPK